tara:strand:- start:5357 stop:5866 length:510 start_codon:yes stop_codon:yes gene_type:complete
MALLTEEPTFDRPIPGQSLTAELGGRPWQTPPQYTTIDEVLNFYMAGMSSEDFMLQAVDILEMGVPVTTLANTIQMSNVMEGIHSIDTGMLALPVIMEMLMLLGDSAKIEYDKGLEEKNPKTRDSLLAKFASQYKEVLDEVDLEAIVEDEEEIMEGIKEEPSGLMARRG